MTALVVVAPLKEGMAGRAQELLEQGPPFDLEATMFDRHAVHVTDHEVVFVFESTGPAATLELPAAAPELRVAAEAWQRVLRRPAPRRPQALLLGARGGAAGRVLRLHPGARGQRRRRRLSALETRKTRNGIRKSTDAEARAEKHVGFVKRTRNRAMHTENPRTPARAAENGDAGDDWLRELFSGALDLREADTLRRSARSSEKARRSEPE